MKGLCDNSYFMVLEECYSRSRFFEIKNRAIYLHAKRYWKTTSVQFPNSGVEIDEDVVEFISKLSELSEQDQENYLTHDQC